MKLITDNKEHLIASIKRNNDEKLAVFDKFSSQHVINKKITSEHKYPEISELKFTKQTISVSKAMYQHISMLAVDSNSSLSNVGYRLLQTGIQHWNKDPKTQVKQHCRQLIVQMNAIVKSLAVEILKFEKADFEQLRLTVINKYQQLTTTSE